MGIGIIYQELNLCPNLSVAENIFLGRELAPTGLVVDKKAQRTKARALMQRLEHDIAPDAMVSELRIGQQQIVEIAKALAQDVRILIMDEPTSALSAAEVEVLFKVIADLKAHGVSIIYISHKLEEITRISDYVTVLRDGRLVAEERVPLTSTCPGSSKRWSARTRPVCSRRNRQNSATRFCASKR